VDGARRNDPSIASVAVVAEGKRRVDALRAQFRELVAAETKLGATRNQRADDAARQAIIAASVGLVVSLLLIILYVVYLTRAIVRPVRRASLMAGQLARGDLSVRMPETGTAEIGARTFVHHDGELAGSVSGASPARRRTGGVATGRDAGRTGWSSNGDLPGDADRSPRLLEADAAGLIGTTGTAGDGCCRPGQ
jgi:HAMP domain-containing protein